MRRFVGIEFKFGLVVAPLLFLATLLIPGGTAVFYLVVFVGLAVASPFLVHPEWLGDNWFGRWFRR